MLLRILAITIMVTSVAAYGTFRYIDGLKDSHDVVVANTLTQLSAQAIDSAAASIRAQLKAGQNVTLPSPTSEPLCAPTVNPCYNSANISYVLAGSTTTSVASSTTSTAYNVARSLNEGRFYVNVDVKIVNTESGCPVQGCPVGEKMTPYAFRTWHAAPYVSFEPALSLNQESQNGQHAAPADYSGCNSTSGCGTLPANGATPAPRTIGVNTNCVDSAYGGCAVSTAPPANVQNIVYPNQDAH